MRRTSRRQFLGGITVATCVWGGCLSSGERTATTLQQYSAGVATVDEGTAYFGSIEDIYAIDLESGDAVSTYQESANEIDQPPSVRDDAVYVSENSGGGVHAIEAGERRWHFDELDGDASRPIPFDDAVYVNAGGVLYELDRSDGRIRRERALETTYPSIPAVRTDAPYLVTGGQLWALDRSTLEIDWTHPVAESSEVVTRDDRLFVSSREHNGLAAIDKHDGTLYWSADIGPIRRAVVTDGAVFASEQERGQIAAYDLDGTERWISGKAGKRSVPAVGSNAVFVVSHGAGELRSLDRETGEQNWSFEIEPALRYWPTNAPDHVLVPTDNGMFSVEK